MDRFIARKKRKKISAWGDLKSNMDRFIAERFLYLKWCFKI